VATIRISYLPFIGYSDFEFVSIFEFRVSGLCVPDLLQLPVYYKARRASNSTRPLNTSSRS
jgi:hypothetical protein